MRKNAVKAARDVDNNRESFSVASVRQTSSSLTRARTSEHFAFSLDKHCFVNRTFLEVFRSPWCLFDFFGDRQRFPDDVSVMIVNAVLTKVMIASTHSSR